MPTDQDLRMSIRFLLGIALLLSSTEVFGQNRAPFVPGTRARVVASGMMAEVTFYNPKNGRTDGLVANVVPPLSSGPGYQEWKVELNRADGKAFDVDFEIEVRLYHNYNAHGMSTTQTIECKQGALSASQKFYSTRWNRSIYWHMKFFRNGLELKGLDSGFQSMNQQLNQHGVAVLFVGIEEKQTTPDFDNQTYFEEYDGQFSTLFMDYPSCSQVSLPIDLWRKGNANFGEYRFALPSRLPNDWIGYSRFNVICLPKESFDILTIEQLKAIAIFLRGGGDLIVTRCESKAFDEVRAKLFGSSDQGSNQDEWTSEPPTPLPTDGAETMESHFGLGTLQTTSIDSLKDRQKFFDGNAGAAKSGLNRVALARNTWETMRGTSSGAAAGTNFWNWLIPDVGKPPVWSFIAFVVLFAGIAGPALCYLTMKARRPSWLLILFPILASMVTFLMISYAVLHDGFKTLTRIRSLTWYDVRKEEGFSWSRQTIFSGAPPQDGLIFDQGTEVSPLAWKDEFREYGTSNSTIQRLDDKNQRFTGLLKHREQRQLLVRHPVQRLAPFKISTGESMRFVNGLNQTLPLVLVLDQDKKQWVGEAIAPKGEVLLQEMDSSKSGTLLAKEINREPLLLPQGLTQGQQVSIFDWMNNRSSLASWSTNAPMMEEFIEGVSAPDSLPARSFVLFLSEADFIDRAIDGAIENHSMHLMIGRW